ncbi:MAG: AmmeMemoRadiSam system protein B [Candidatus Sumerlaeota bacterium]
MSNISPLRPIEPIPVDVNGRQLVVLRDPMRFMENDVSVSVPAYMILCMLDGTRSISRICSEFQQRFGTEVPRQDVEKLVDDLDKVGLLQNERYLEIREKALEAFSQAPVREAAHAGSAYEGTPEALRKQIDSFYTLAREQEPVTPVEDDKAISGLVAPHIDPRVGGVCAAHAYRLLDESTAEPPELFVLFGTAHQPGSQLFTVLDKPWETPLGRTEADGEALAALKNSLPMLDLTADQYLHKFEHSIEFQLIFLQHLYGTEGMSDESLKNEKRPHSFEILPILVGSFHEFLETNTLPSFDEEVDLFTNAMREVIAKSGKRVCFVIGADLSHMGKKFGDSHGAEEQQLARTRQQDREMLSHLADDNPEAFFRHLQIDGDRQKVCGLPPIYTALNILGEGHPARLLQYDISIEEPTDSFVSYASLAIM